MSEKEQIELVLWRTREAHMNRYKRGDGPLNSDVIWLLDELIKQMQQVGKPPTPPAAS